MADEVSLFCISAFRKPRLITLSTRVFTHENRKKFRRLCFADTRTIFIVPRTRGARSLADNPRAEDFYRLVSSRGPDMPFMGTIFVLSYTQTDRGSIALKDINKSTQQYVNNYMTFYESLEML